ncbi:putative E3 ubiquitin-protein ligase LIN-1 [Aristolochia californica]|uniref:putative E3 ubiquitin-protein ligase LIN-1 n=1 Tax=Aristolochia californica TaxID=171875 RepID=UPI0035E02C1A
MDAIVKALDCDSNSTTVQEQLSKALSLLGGKFSYTGEALVETWLLEKAEMVWDKTTRLDDEESKMESWIQKAATVLLSSGKRRFLAGLSNAIANGIPCLAHSCLVTVAWISSSLVSFKNADIGLMATSVLTPCLLENLNSDKDEHEMLLSSLALANLARNSERIRGQVMLLEQRKE